MQPRSNESPYSRKNGSGERCVLEEKETGLKRIRVRGTRVLPVIAGHLSGHHPALGQNQIEEQGSVEKRFWDTMGQSNQDLESERKKRCRRDETLMPSTSGYNLSPRIGAKKESRSLNEKRTQQGGPVRSRRSREKQQYRPYT
ncbi:hypothetical protein TNCV_2806191 [Trichonephila clavipes]|nr:hypothetical protein TNCV_2806191 [Trichonephila clavipes]